MQFTAAQIAQLANGTVEGNPDVAVSTFAKIEEGHPGAISFLANAKYTHYIYETASSVVLVSRDFVAERPVKATLIRVDDPYATVASLLEMVAEMLEPKPRGIEQPCFIAEGVEVPDDAYIGAFAYIAKGVRLGRGVKIYPQTYVGENVVIGDNAQLKPGVKVYHNCHIGARCILHSGVVVGGDGFGFAPHDGHYKKIPQLGNVVIDDDVEIGANTTVDRAVMGSTRIGAGTKIDNLIQIAHNCTLGHDTVMAAQAGHIKVGDNVQIGAQSGVHSNLRDGARVLGTPAIPVGDYARMNVYLKRLGDIFERVKKLEESQTPDSENK